MSKKTIRDMVSVLKLCLRDAGAAGGIGGSGMRFFYPVQERRQGQEEPVCGADTGTTIRTGDIGTQDGGRRVTESVLTQTQVMDYLRALRRKQTPQTLGISLCLYTGMRIGEICALQWQDIDLANRLVHVTKTLQRVYLKSPEGRGSSRVLITTPKSACSVRVIPLADEICGMLGRLASDVENYVITGTKNYMEPRAYRRFYARFVEENALPYIRFHGLRHTFATRCIQAGADTKTVSELLGHSSVALTMNLYVHPQMEEKRRLVNLLALPS